MPTLDVAINSLRAKAGATQFDQAAAKIKQSAKNIDRGIAQTQKGLGGLGDKFKTVAKAALGMAAVYGVSRFLKSSIQEMAQYELGLANVSTMLDESSMKFMPKYEKELSKLAIKYGEATGTLSKGLYDILSASVDAAEALDVLDVAARAAKAGLTDTGKAADILTTIINAYGMSAGQAEEIADILFATVKRGKTTFDELANSMGMVVSLAATSNLSIEEVSAALATMTRAGISTDMAVTSLKGILTTFLSPTEQNIEAAKKLGLELNSNTLRTIGLTGAVKKLEGASAEQIAAVFTNVRALTGLSSLLQATDGYMIDLGETTNASGKMMEAFGKVTKTTTMELGQFRETWKATKREIGKAAAEDIGEFTEVLENTTPILSKLVVGFIKVGKASPLYTILKLSGGYLKLNDAQKAVNTEWEGSYGVYRTTEQGLVRVSDAIEEVVSSTEEFVPPSEKFLDALEKITGATNKVKTEIEQFGMTDIEKQIAQFEQLGVGLNDEELKAFTNQLVILQKELAKLAELETGKEGAEKAAEEREKEIQYIDDQANAYRRLYDDLDQQSTDSYNNKLLLLNKERDEYAVFIDDKILLDQWYAERKTELDREAAIASDNFFAGFNAQMNQMGENLTTMGEIGQLTAQTIGSAFTNAMMTMTMEGSSFKDAMKGFALDIGRAFLKALTEMIAMQMLAAAFGVGGGGGGFTNPMAVFGAPTGGEKGLVLKNGKITAFGKGDVINRPTIFPMANGMGIMAEKKPEAVMPLARDESGRLGVRAEGGGGTTVIKMMNILDESLFEDYLATGDGERAVVNIMRRNQAETEVTL